MGLFAHLQSGGSLGFLGTTRQRQRIDFSGLKPDKITPSKATSKKTGETIEGLSGQTQAYVDMQDQYFGAHEQAYRKHGGDPGYVSSDKGAQQAGGLIKYDVWNQNMIKHSYQEYKDQTKRIGDLGIENRIAMKVGPIGNMYPKYGAEMLGDGRLANMLTLGDELLYADQNVNYVRGNEPGSADGVKFAPLDLDKTVSSEAKFASSLTSAFASVGEASRKTKGPRREVLGYDPKTGKPVYGDVEIETVEDKELNAATSFFAETTGFREGNMKQVMDAAQHMIDYLGEESENYLWGEFWKETESRDSGELKNDDGTWNDIEVRNQFHTYAANRIWGFKDKLLKSKREDIYDVSSLGTRDLSEIEAATAPTYYNEWIQGRVSGKQIKTNPIITGEDGKPKVANFTVDIEVLDESTTPSEFADRPTAALKGESLGEIATGPISLLAHPKEGDKQAKQGGGGGLWQDPVHYQGLLVDRVVGMRTDVKPVSDGKGGYRAPTESEIKRDGLTHYIIVESIVAEGESDEILSGINFLANTGDYQDAPQVMPIVGTGWQWDAITDEAEDDMQDLVRFSTMDAFDKETVVVSGGRDVEDIPGLGWGYGEDVRVIRSKVPVSEEFYTMFDIEGTTQTMAKKAGLESSAIIQRQQSNIRQMNEQYTRAQKKMSALKNINKYSPKKTGTGILKGLNIPPPPPK